MTINSIEMQFTEFQRLVTDLLEVLNPYVEFLTQTTDDHAGDLVDALDALDGWISPSLSAVMPSMATPDDCALCGFPTHTTEAHKAEYMREHKASISVRAIGKREAGTWTVTEREAE
jgi:hypothetical protein